MANTLIPEFGWESASATNAHQYLIRAVDLALGNGVSRAGSAGQRLRVFDAGCGNGYLAGHLINKGFEVAACDASQQGIDQALKKNPQARFEVCSVYDDLAERFGRNWDVVVSSEVIEHLYDPRCFVKQAGEMLKPGGLLLITTPYHGYLKNVALALANKLDAHFTALWDGGHIKFWSYNTLKQLLAEREFSEFKFYGAGRFPYLWKSMVVTAVKGW